MQRRKKALVWIALVLLIVFLGAAILANSIGENINRYYFGRRSQSFEIGPAISDQVVEWLDANVVGRIVRLPVEVKTGLSGIESSSLTSGKTRVFIHLRDLTSAGLAHNIKPYCSSGLCRIWLEGKWGAPTPDSDLSPEERPLFSVTKVVGKAESEDVNVQVALK